MRVGSPWLDQRAQTTADVRVQQVILNSRFRSHRYWSWVGQSNNIGLLQLERTLNYSKYVWPICLPGLDYRVKDFSLCTVTGWGLPRANGESHLQTRVGCGRGPGTAGVPRTDVSETSSREPPAPTFLSGFLKFYCFY